MPKTATVRDLRNHFPKLKKLVEAHGEIVVTDRGEARYKLSLYRAEPASVVPAVDYFARLASYQPTAISRAEAESLHEENRGDR